MLAVRVGPYELLGEIGRGGSGAVFEARGARGEALAIKLLRAPNPEARRRFERERRLLASLGDEDGFVPIADAGEWAHGPYLVMPFLGGGTLRARLDRGSLAFEETIELGRALAGALGHAHEKGIVHRDLKPENVLFTSAGEPRVADLGLAKHFTLDAPGGSQSVSLSGSGEIRGTAGYMAPEQMRDAGKVGPRADVFALGAILYECLAGVPAFLGRTPLDVIGKVESSASAPLRSLRHETPRWLEAVIERALAHSEPARYADGGALARALEPPRPASRAVALVGAAVLVAAGGLALAFLLPPGPAPPAPPAAPPAPPGRPAVPPRPAFDAAAAFELAREKLHAGDLEAARRELDRILEKDPENAEVLACRAEVRLRLDDRDGAIADAGRAVAIDRRCTIGWANRGWARLTSGDLDGAIADLTEAIALDPERASAYGDRASAHFKKAQFDEAVSDATRAVELDPKQSGAWADRAQIRLQRGDLDGAIADATRSLEVTEGRPTAWFTRGIARAKKGERKDAIEDLRRCIALDPTQIARPLLEQLEAEEARQR